MNSIELGDLAMNSEEKALLDHLFERIKTAGSSPRDTDAEHCIEAAVKELPHAAYVLTQAIILQEQALKAADARLHELEARLAEAEKQKAAETSFLGGIGASLFGGAKTGSGVPVTGASPQAQPRPGVWGTPLGQAPTPSYPSQAYAPVQPGGSFLSGALSTAAGVAGGALLFEGISSLFRGDGSGSPFVTPGLPGGPVVNETVYENVNVYEQPSQTASSSSDWISADDNSSYDAGFGGDDTGGDDWA